MFLAFLGDVGGSELLLIGVVALVVLGPQRFPEIARKMGQLMGHFRRASTDLQRQLNNELRDAGAPPGAGPSFGTQAAAWVSRLKTEVSATLVEKPAGTAPAVTDGSEPKTEPPAPLPAAPPGSVDVASTPAPVTPPEAPVG